MRRKFLILVISLLLIPIVMMIGQSSWVIIGEKTTNIDSKYYPFDINWHQETIYNGQPQQITVTPDENYEYNDCTYTYYDSESNLLSGNPKNAGTYYCDVTYNTEQIAYVEFVINKKPLTITANSNSITYGDILSGNGVTYSGFVEGEDESVLEGTLSYTSNYDNSSSTSRDAGTYDLIPTGLSNPNYEITFVKNTLNVNKKNTEFTWSNLELVYNGQEQQPSCNMNTTLYGDSTQITVNGKGKDVGSYDVNISNNLKNYNLVENATNSYNSTFNITSRTIDASWSTTNTFVYDGNQKTVAVTLNDGGTSKEISTITGETVTPIIQYSLKDANSWTETAPTNAGTYDVKIVGFKVNGSVTNNYVISSTTATTTMKINKADIDMTGVSFSNQTISYDGKSHTIEVSGTLPAGITSVTYTNDKGTTPGNQLTDPGSIVITAHFNVDDNHNSVSDMQATLTITNKKKVKFIISGGTYTYDGESHPAGIITYVDGVESTLPSGITTTVLYKVGTSTPTTNAPKNAGTYEIVFNAQIGSTVADLYELEKDNTINNDGKIIINPMSIYLVSGNIEIDYSSDNQTYSNFTSAAEDKIRFTKTNGDDITLKKDTDYNISGMHDGTFSYGDEIVSGLDTSMKSVVVGSTYQAKITTSGNYIIANSNYKIIKYKTAMIGDKYYTIEDALTLINSGDITFEGNASSASTYVTTAFSNLTIGQGYPYSSKTYEVDRRNIIVAQSSGSSSDYTKVEATSPSTSYVYSCLYISSGITLNVNSGSTISIRGVLSGRGLIGDHGVIVNSGIINMNSGSTLTSYGYLKNSKDNNGVINLYSDSKAYDVMAMLDYSSAGDTLKLKNANVFPILSWFLQNISCKTKVYNGAELLCNSSIWGNTAGFHHVTVSIIGKNSSASNCLFRPNSKSSSSDYILKETVITKNNINDIICYNNQVTSRDSINQMDNIEIHGNYDDNSVKVTLSGISMQTSTSIPIPIPYMNIIVSKNSILNISNSSFVFLPGTSLVVETNAVLNINSGSYMAFDRYESGTSSLCSFFAGKYLNSTSKKSSVLLNNGTINGQGSLGGIVDVTSENAYLNASNYEVSSIKIKSGNNAAATISKYSLIGNVASNANSTFTSGTAYGSSLVDSTYTWFIASNVKEFKVQFYDDPDLTTLLAEKTLTVVNKDSYTLTGTEFTPTKTHYLFKGWKDENGNIISDNSITLTDTSVITKLYAYWEKVQYELYYQAGYGTNEDGTPVYVTEGTTLSNVLTSFTISDFVDGNINITTTAAYNDKVFNGWYLGINSTDYPTSIKSTFTLSMLNAFVDNFNSTMIPLYCYFTDTEYFNIIINDDKNNYSTNVRIEGGKTLQNTGNAITDTTSKLQNDLNSSFYFSCFKDSEGNSYTISQINALEIIKNMEFTAEYINKCSVTVSKDSGRYTPTGTLKITGYPDITFDGTKSITKYVLLNTTVSFTFGNNIETVKCNNSTYNSGDEVIITGDTTFKITATCIVAGTLITLADGTQKKVEDLVIGDQLIVFNHETGKYDVAPLLVNVHANEEISYYNVINLYFDNGNVLRIVAEHGLFDKDLNKYVYITEDNAHDYIGHRFVSTTYENGEYVNTFTKLVKCEITYEYIKVYNPASVWHINLVAENMLTLSAGMVNLFEYDNNMKYDEQQMKEDIEKYGLYTYDDFKDYVTIDVFNAFPFKYYKVAVGKGLFTFEEIIGLINYYYDSNSLN